MSDATIEKIEKLLALANSSNEHEARLAAAKAYELMERNHITEAALGAAEHTFEFAGGARRTPPEWRWINPLLERYFHVAPIVCRDRAEHVVVLTLIGTRSNVAVAKHVCIFLSRSYRACWNAFRRRKGKRAKPRHRTDVYRGLMLGLAQQLEQQREAMGLPTLLATPRDPALERAIAEIVGKTADRALRKTRRRANQAFATGYRQGRDLRIRKAVEGDSQHTGKALPCL